MTTKEKEFPLGKKKENSPFSEIPLKPVDSENIVSLARELLGIPEGIEPNLYGMMRAVRRSEGKLYPHVLFPPKTPEAVKETALLHEKLHEECDVIFDIPLTPEDLSLSGPAQIVEEILINREVVKRLKHRYAMEVALGSTLTYLEKTKHLKRIMELLPHAKLIPKSQNAPLS